MKSSKTHILKFGGSSLQNKSLIAQAVQIIADKTPSVQPVVVVSAIDGTTDTLVDITEHHEKATMLIDELAEKHLNLFSYFSDQPADELEHLFDELHQLADDESYRLEEYKAWKDQILSFGEQLSSLIVAEALKQHQIAAQAVNAYQFVKTDPTFGEAKVDAAETRTLIRQYFAESEGVSVVTGFIGSDREGRITTLGRSGSDYTAALIADALDAEHLEIWTDVDGVLTADPKRVPTARHIEALSFDDIEQLSAHGASVIHPKTIRPIRQKNTTVQVKNSHNPDHVGTYISGDITSNGSFKSITINGPFVWLPVSGHRADELSFALDAWIDEDETFSYSRNSSFENAHFLLEQSLFQAIENEVTEWYKKHEIAFKPERNVYKLKKFSNYFIRDEQLTSRIWNLLAQKDLQPLQVERNRKERFISFLFDEGDINRAARLFDDYIRPAQKVIDLFIAGTGAVGHTLLQQLRAIERDDVVFRLVGICNSRVSLWDEYGIDFDHELDWSDAEPTNWDAITQRLKDEHGHNIIFIDATGSETVARLYPELLEHRIHVVTPSKLANTFEQSFFDEIQKTADRHHASFQYETTVGAGLPVISTIRDLQKSGDKITETSGVVSGTMTYIFNQAEKGVPFSEAVIKARELGYAEPDPRDDLSGEDIARKFLTMARTMGLAIERDELDVESLIPDELITVNRTEFLERLSDYDAQWKQRFEEAQKEDKTLRYVGKLKEGDITIGLEVLPVDSPLGQLKGTDNLIQIYSQFYNQTPLIIQGPGAGKQVTAAGVWSDVLKVADRLE